jgi:hypothetical protein
MRSTRKNLEFVKRNTFDRTCSIKKISKKKKNPMASYASNAPSKTKGEQIVFNEK